MRIKHARAYPSTVAIAFVGAMVWMPLLHGCAATTEVMTPQSVASPINDERYEKVLKLLAEEPNTVLQIASKHALESATPQELVGLSCLAQGRITRVESRGEASDKLKKFIAALVATLPRAEHACASISEEWHVAFFTYSRWKTHRAPEQPPREPSEFEQGIYRGLGQGLASPHGVVLIGAGVLYVATAYAVTCVYTAGVICPIPGETIFVALGTSAVSQEGKEANLVGVGVAQGSTQISAWSGLLPDAEALAMAFAQAFKSLASNYAAILVAEAANPVQSEPNP